MKVAVMQPYVFPYLGYFQLMNLVDIWVWYDDVNFIKRGYVNRNTLKNNLGFTIPVSDLSQFRKINQTMVSAEHDFWVGKMKKQLYHLYHKSEFYDSYIDEIIKIFSIRNISEMAVESGKFISEILDFKTEFRFSSNMKNDELHAQNRILDICLKLNADVYINPIGGKDLYSVNDFRTNKLELKFMKMLTEKPEDNLSVLHFLLEKGPEAMKEKLISFELS